MSDTLKQFLGGVIVVAVIAAVGLHAAQLGPLVTKAGSAGGGLIKTAQGSSS